MVTVQRQMKKMNESRGANHEEVYLKEIMTIEDAKFNTEIE